MVIDKDVTKDETKLNQIVSKTVVSYIKEQIKNGNQIVKTADIINVCYHAVGYRDEILANNDVRNRVNSAITKVLTSLEQVEAIGNQTNLVLGFKNFLEFKKAEQNIKVRELPIKKPLTYYVSNNFSKQVALLKTNEQILNSGKAVFFTGENESTVVVVKESDLNKVKECNLIFDYSSMGDYLGCLNKSTNRVDLVSTTPDPKRFYVTNQKHIAPTERNMENLYYLINFSTEYKTMFENSEANENKTNANAKKSLKYSKILATDSSREAYLQSF